jgi:hypothetical protein
LFIDSLERRSVYQDLRFTYKILFGLVKVDAGELFTLSQTVHDARRREYNFCPAIAELSPANIFYLSV